MTTPHGIEQRLALQYEVSRALAESDTIAEAATRVLEHVGTHLGWARGAYWAFDDERQELCPMAIWSRVVPGDNAYETETKKLRFRIGEGLPGHVMQSGKPAWIAAIETDPGLPRKKTLLAEGLRAGFGFPVVHGGRVIGVIEFFTEQPEAESESLLQTTTAIGFQIGQFIERKRAVERERAAELRNAAVVELALDSIVTIDRHGRILEFNPAAERTFGYKRSDVIGKPMAELIVPPAFRAAHYTGLERYLATGEAHVLGRRLELEGMRSDGSVFPVELAIMRVPVPGEPVFTSYLRDVSAQRRTAARQKLLLDASALLASSLHYEQTLRNISRVVIPAFADWYTVDVVDPKTGEVHRLVVEHRDPDKVALANAMAEKYRDTREDRGVAKVLRTGETEWLREIPNEVIRDAAMNAEHGRMLEELGLRSYILAPLKARNTVLGAIGFVSAESGRLYDEDDVAIAEELGRRAGQAVENARLFSEVEEQRELLQQANRAKSAFLAAMSHELRTPLNAIIGYTDLLTTGVHGAVSDPQRDRLERIKRSAHHLVGLINDILSFARLEAGRLTYDIARVSVKEVLHAAEELVAPQMVKKHLRLDRRDESAGELVCADREKLLQILTNLLSNAVRHSPENGTIVLASRRDKSEIVFRVRDSGPGIPDDKLEEIFHPFVQVEDTYAGDRQGTGLGLSISRELARAMHGDVTVESELGKGATFKVTLPAAD